MDNIVFLLSLVCAIQINLVLVESLSCYKCEKSRGLPAEKDCHKVTCSSPTNTSCEIRVTRLKKPKDGLHVLDAHLRCASLTQCNTTGIGCKDSPNKEQESCGICCEGDYCNHPKLATFSNAGTFSCFSGVLGLALALVAFIAVY